MVSRAALIGAGSVAAAVLARKALAVARTGRTTGDDEERWQVVTVNRPPEEVAPGGRCPQPLAELGGSVEIRTAPAPGGRGTELAVRALQTGAVRKRPRPEQIRRAVRDAKELLEVGEILRNEPRPHGKRSASPAGWLVDRAEKHARGGGNL
ncbi:MULTISPECIES: hypothetical protein [Kocuria]|jgi:hypothetical protein|uniref:hypothetical protein n=1 Tax=Kocuria TaxID=57493 RepID=UPI00203EF8AD|nr:MULTISPECIES: hypothetical protein [Kocuria]MCM3686510.1 hypothetical protein [Kocuria rosea]HST70889.1 hypothetical protein [Kocuria rosea]